MTTQFSKTLLHCFPLVRPRLRYCEQGKCISFARLWRILIVTLMITSYSVIAWSMLVPEVHAAAVTEMQVNATQLQQRERQQTPKLSFQHPLGTKPHPNLSMGGSLNELGNLPFYTYIQRTINDRKSLQVNVANGNLVVASNDLHVRGTAGLDLTITSTYNSLSNNTLTLGHNWQLNLGPDVSLTTSGSSVLLNGPSGYTATFTTGSSGYNQVPGLNATLVHNGDGTWTLTFNRTAEQYLFNASGQMTADRDKNSNTISFSYNASNKLSKITDTQGRSYTIGYSGGSYITSITDPTGRSIKYGYDTSNRLTSNTDAAGKVTTFTYNGTSNRIASITDPMNVTTQVTYDSQGRVATIVDGYNQPEQGTTTLTYNSGNTVVQDQRGHNTTYTFSTCASGTGAGIVCTVVNDSGVAVSTQGYTSNYDVATSMDALNNQTTSTYSTDGYNNLLSTQDATEVKTTATYNNTNFPYYPDTQTDGQGNISSLNYDGNGNLNSSSNSKMGIGVSSTYNSDGTLSQSKDANGYATNYSYTGGNLTSVTPPSPQKAESISYDSLSRVSKVVDGNGNTITYAYTPMDYVKSITYSSSTGNSSLTYTYDANGNNTGVTDSSVSSTATTFAYDSLNRQTQKTLPDGSTIKYHYDLTNDLTKYVDSSGTVTYTYNNLNQLTSLVEPDTAYSGTTGTDTVTFGYDNAGHRTSVGFQGAGGVSMNISYDNAGRISEISSPGEFGPTVDYKYSYLNGSSATSLVYSLNATLGGTSWTATYGYDGLNRLTTASTSGSGYNTTSSYKYDANGNRTSGSTLVGSGTTILNPYNNTYHYDTANELQQVNATQCRNDGNGNQVGCGTTYVETYNERNQTTSMSGPGGMLNDQYTGADQTERTSTSGAYITNDTYSSLGLSIEKDTSGNTYAYTRDNQGHLVSERTSTGNYFYLLDNIGSVVGMFNTSGTLVNTYIYDPYGVTEEQNVTQYNPWQFAGGYFDASTLYYKFGTRYYDRFGRWTQQDPLPSANPYVYADDDPVNTTDPSGKLDFGLIIQYPIVDGVTLPIPIVTGLFVTLNSGDLTGYVPAILAGIALTITLFAPILGPVGTQVAGVAVSTLGIGALEAAGFSAGSCGGGSVRVSVYFANAGVPIINCE